MSSKFSRLDFLRVSAAGASTLVIPSVLSKAEAAPKKKAEDNFIKLGFIGLGQQSLSLLSGMISAVDQVRVVAGADIYDIKRDRFTKRVNDWYAEKGIKNKFTIYNYPEQLLADPNVDAVVIATPDHWHAAIAIAACKAGKDVYLEKPLTFTVYEGQRLIEAVRANHIVFQTGSMQRSMSVFRHAAE
ncbi:MAG: Gfo/Idh/MocA family oxidoreductase, partial [Alistipes sp.]|nr:Gfo/Idh/MocA family oxidoreductase [Alistipes sp.]